MQGMPQIWPGSQTVSAPQASPCCRLTQALAPSTTLTHWQEAPAGPHGCGSRPPGQSRVQTLWSQRPLRQRPPLPHGAPFRRFLLHVPFRFLRQGGHGLASASSLPNARRSARSRAAVRREN